MFNNKKKKNPSRSLDKTFGRVAFNFRNETFDEKLTQLASSVRLRRLIVHRYYSKGELAPRYHSYNIYFTPGQNFPSPEVRSYKGPQPPPRFSFCISPHKHPRSEQKKTPLDLRNKDLLSSSKTSHFLKI